VTTVNEKCLGWKDLNALQWCVVICSYPFLLLLFPRKRREIEITNWQTFSCFDNYTTVCWSNSKALCQSKSRQEEEEGGKYCNLDWQDQGKGSYLVKISRLSLFPKLICPQKPSVCLVLKQYSPLHVRMFTRCMYLTSLLLCALSVRLPDLKLWEFCYYVCIPAKTYADRIIPDYSRLNGLCDEMKLQSMAKLITDKMATSFGLFTPAYYT
jgi:hypothetical protein